MPRRKPRTGSVYRRRDGRWVAAVMVEGKRLAKYARTEEAAHRLLDEMTLAPDDPKLLTLGRWLDQWLLLRAAEVREITLRHYRQLLRHLVVGDLGKTRLSEITPLALASWFAAAQQTRGRRVLATTHTLLGRALADAVGFGLLPANPLARVRRPVWEKRRRRYWDEEQARAFLAACEQSWSRVAPLLIVLLTTGLRYGEAMGLDWREIDLAKRRLRVVQATAYLGDGEWATNNPKTEAGIRVISLPEAAVEALRRAGPREGGPVFRTKAGDPMRRESAKRVLLRLCAKAGVPATTLHGLRHVHAMLALRATGDMHAVARRLGHASVVTTMRLYAYTTRDDSSVAASLDALLARLEEERREREGGPAAPDGDQPPPQTV